MALILIKNHMEEQQLMELIKEFGNKLVLPRNFKANETFKSFAKDKVYGVMEIIREGNDVIYDIAYPDHYVAFMSYLINQVALIRAS